LNVELTYVERSEESKRGVGGGNRFSRSDLNATCPFFLSSPTMLPHELKPTSHARRLWRRRARHLLAVVMVYAMMVDMPTTSTTTITTTSFAVVAFHVVVSLPSTWWSLSILAPATINTSTTAQQARYGRCQHGPHEDDLGGSVRPISPPPLMCGQGALPFRPPIYCEGDAVTGTCKPFTPPPASIDALTTRRPSHVRPWPQPTHPANARWSTTSTRTTTTRRRRGHRRHGEAMMAKTNPTTMTTGGSAHQNG
jgi:hypothetical protein